MEINEGRGNANKTMARLLLPVLGKMDGRLASIHGGNLRNAIPREAVAVVAVPEANVSKMKRKVADIGKKVKAELALIDPNVVIAVNPAAKAKVMAGDVALNVVKAVLACPNEVVRMSNAMENLVETSSNLAMVNSDGRRVRIECLLRSSVDTAKENLADAIASVMTLAGGKVKYSGAYSGWSPTMRSPLLAQMIKEHKGLYGKEPAVMAIHAGLECGVIGAKYEGLDMVSVGPTLCSPHSPDERVNVATVGKFWDFIVKVLANAPVKE